MSSFPAQNVFDARPFEERKDIVRDLAGAGQFRMADQQRQAVARHLDFGDDGHAAEGRVLHQFLEVRLRVESLVRLRLLVTGRETGAFRREFGIFLISTRHPWSSVRCRCSTFIL